MILNVYPYSLQKKSCHIHTHELVVAQRRFVVGVTLTAQVMNYPNKHVYWH